MRTISVSLVAVILLIPAFSNAQSTLALQEKCFEGGKKFFFEKIKSYGGRWGSFSDQKGHGYNDFATHYSKELGKCFIRIEYSYFPKERDGQSIKAIEIYDAFRGIRVAGISLRILSPPDCKVEEKTCNSLSEFETLIKPYMESKGEVGDVDWKYFASGEGGVFCCYDGQSVIAQPDEKVRVWVKTVKAPEIVQAIKGGAKMDQSHLEKMISEKDYKLYLMEIDCIGRTIGIRQKYNCDSKDVLKGGESERGAKQSIPADSVAEKLYKAVCK